jgi:homoserine O-succinyltransferase
LKEYKREVNRFKNNEINEPPPFPKNYFSESAKKIANSYIYQLINSKEKKEELMEFPEEELKVTVDNTWGDTGKAIFNNWLGLVYSLTSHDRLKQYMDGVDPENPLDTIK